MKTLVIVPTYNEKDNFRELADSLFHAVPEIELLVVDDSSPDGTGDLVRTMMSENPRIHLLTRPQKQGIARAYVAGFHWALQRDYEIVITMDGDMSHHPSYIPQFLSEIGDFDVVIGSRWVPGGNIRDWSFFRMLISRGATVYARLVLGVPVQDYTGGFNCYRREVLETIGPENIHADGYGFQIEMKYRAFCRGFRLKEVPIIFPDRRKGKSKFSRRIIWEAIILVWKLRLSRHIPRTRNKAAVIDRG